MKSNKKQNDTLCKTNMFTKIFTQTSNTVPKLNFTPINKNNKGLDTVGNIAFAIKNYSRLIKIGYTLSGDALKQLFIGLNLIGNSKEFLKYIIAIDSNIKMDDTVLFRDVSPFTLYKLLFSRTELTNWFQFIRQNFFDSDNNLIFEDDIIDIYKNYKGQDNLLLELIFGVFILYYFYTNQDAHIFKIRELFKKLDTDKLIFKRFIEFPKIVFNVGIYDLTYALRQYIVESYWETLTFDTFIEQYEYIRLHLQISMILPYKDIQYNSHRLNITPLSDDKVNVFVSRIVLIIGLYSKTIENKSSAELSSIEFGDFFIYLRLISGTAKFLETIIEIDSAVDNARYTNVEDTNYSYLYKGVNIDKFYVLLFSKFPIWFEFINQYFIDSEGKLYFGSNIIDMNSDFEIETYETYYLLRHILGILLLYYFYTTNEANILELQKLFREINKKGIKFSNFIKYPLIVNNGYSNNLIALLRSYSLKPAFWKDMTFDIFIEQYESIKKYVVNLFKEPQKGGSRKRYKLSNRKTKKINSK